MKPFRKILFSPVYWQRYLIKLFDNLLGRWYLGVPRGKKIYKITPSSVHYYTNEKSKRNGLPVICTGYHSPGQRPVVFQKLRRLANVLSLFVFLPFFPKILLPLVIGMADTGYRSPGTVVDDDTVGTVAWSNPDNAKTSNNVYVQSGDLLDVSHYLKATNFGFTIPEGNQIDGILGEIERKSYSSYEPIIDNEVKIVKSDGTIGTTNKAGGQWPDTDTYALYGSSSDLWDETWEYTDINDIDFGIVLSAAGVYGWGIAMVDHIRIKVYYTEAPPVVGKSQGYIF